MTALRSLFASVHAPAPLPPGEEIEALFERVKDTNPSVHSIYNELLEILNLPQTHPMARAGTEIARLIDTDPHIGGHANPYHNKDHMLEVTVSCALLIALHEENEFQPTLTSHEKLILLTAALSHDIGHNGRGNGRGENRIPLLTETHSIELAKPIIAAAYGMDTPPAFRIFAALLGSTDIHGGELAPAKLFSATAACQRGKAPPPFAEGPTQMQFVTILKEYPALAEMSCLLQDADLLPSVGLTPERSEQQERALAIEMPEVHLGPDGDINWKGTASFHEKLSAPKSQAGEIFSPNRLVIIERVLQKAAPK